MPVDQADVAQVEVAVTKPDLAAKPPCLDLVGQPIKCRSALRRCLAHGGRLEDRGRSQREVGCIAVDHLGELGPSAGISVDFGRPMKRCDSAGGRNRSEEHTSELQSPCNLVCRLLLEKKKKTEKHHSQTKSETQNRTKK